MTDPVEDVQEVEQHEEPQNTQEPQQNQPDEAQIEPEEKEEEKNWRAFRDQRKRDRQEAEEARRRAEESERQAATLREIIAAANAQGANISKQTENEMIHSMPLDDFTTGEHVKQYFDSRLKELDTIVERKLEEKERAREQQRREAEKHQLPQRLSRECPNYDDICTQDNFDYLEYHYPEVARSFVMQEDSFEKWSGIYNTIKKLVPNTRAASDARRIESNSQKPRLASSQGMSNTSEEPPVRLTEERKRANYERMRREMKGA